ISPPEPHTEQFELVEPVEQAAEPAPDAPPAGLANWRRRRHDPVATEDTEVGVMPPVRRGPADPGDELEATGFHDPFAGDDDEDGPGEFAAFTESDPRHGEHYDYEPEAEPTGGEQAAGAEPSPAK